MALQSNPNLNFAGSVSAANFTGGGHGLTNVPGAFFWVTDAVTNYQIQPNIGYISTNDTAPVTFTLPLSPMSAMCIRSPVWAREDGSSRKMPIK